MDINYTRRSHGGAIPEFRHLPTIQVPSHEPASCDPYARCGAEDDGRKSHMTLQPCFDGGSPGLSLGGWGVLRLLWVKRRRTSWSHQ